jgi:hypothetical protein
MSLSKKQKEEEKKANKKWNIQAQNDANPAKTPKKNLVANDYLHRKGVYGTGARVWARNQERSN